LDTLVNGIVTAINDILCPNTEVTLASDVTLADGTVLTAGTTITVLDEENAPVGMDDDTTMGEELFCRTSTSRYSDSTTVTIDNGDGTTSTVSVRIYNEEDASDETTLYTISQLKINSKISSDYSVLALTANDGTKDIDQDVADALSNIWDEDFTTANPDSLTGCTFMEYYTAFTGALATNGEEYNSMVSNQETLVGSIDDERQSIMGVSSDEELTNLIKYQYAYNASSRFINVINEMMEDLLNKLG
jgi:flagellar hook-associated protein 1